MDSVGWIRLELGYMKVIVGGGGEGRKEVKLG